MTTEAYRQGCERFTAGRFAEALPLFEQATALVPDDACGREMLACTLGNLGRFEESLGAFERVRALGHECPSCTFNRWVACRELGRAVEGRKALDRSLELDPGNARAWLEKGLLLSGFLLRSENASFSADRYEQARSNSSSDCSRSHSDLAGGTIRVALQEEPDRGVAEVADAVEEDDGRQSLSHAEIIEPPGHPRTL